MKIVSVDENPVPEIREEKPVSTSKKVQILRAADYEVADQADAILNGEKK